MLKGLLSCGLLFLVVFLKMLRMFCFTSMLIIVALVLARLITGYTAFVLGWMLALWLGLAILGAFYIPRLLDYIFRRIV